MLLLLLLLLLLFLLLLLCHYCDYYIFYFSTYSRWFPCGLTRHARKFRDFFMGGRRFWDSPASHVLLARQTTFSLGVYARRIISSNSIKKRQHFRMEFMSEELFSNWRSICGAVWMKRQHFRMEFMPEVLFQAIRFRRDNIFAWSLCQKYYFKQFDSEETTFSHGVYARSIWRSICGAVWVKRQHFRMEFLFIPAVLFQAIRLRRDNIFAWSLCQKNYLAIGDRSAVQFEWRDSIFAWSLCQKYYFKQFNSEETTFSPGVYARSIISSNSIQKWDNYFDSHGVYAWELSTWRSICGVVWVKRQHFRMHGVSVYARSIISSNSIKKRQHFRMEFMTEELFSNWRSICGAVWMKRQHFRMEFMPEVLFQAIRLRRDNIFAWSLWQKNYLAIGDRSAVQFEWRDNIFAWSLLMPEELFSNWRSICGTVWMKRQHFRMEFTDARSIISSNSIQKRHHFRMEFMSEALGDRSAVRFEWKHNIFAWSFCL